MEFGPINVFSFVKFMLLYLEKACSLVKVVCCVFC